MSKIRASRIYKHMNIGRLMEKSRQGRKRQSKFLSSNEKILLQEDESCQGTDSHTDKSKQADGNSTSTDIHFLQKLVNRQSSLEKPPTRQGNDPYLQNISIIEQKRSRNGSQVVSNETAPISNRRKSLENTMINVASGTGVDWYQSKGMPAALRESQDSLEKVNVDLSTHRSKTTTEGQTIKIISESKSRSP